MTAATRELREVLADVVLDVVVFAELADEEELHPDSAAKLLEFAVAALHDLGAADRLWLFGYVKAAAAAEPHPDRRRVLERLRGELLEDDA